MNIAVIGTGYVGLTSGACLANLGHTVQCLDIDEKKIAKLRKGEVPFYEPGLKDIVKKNVEAGRLSFTTDSEKAIQFGDVLISCVGTPQKEDGSADLSFVMAVAETVAKHANGEKVLVNRSTVPPGTAKAMAERMKAQNPKHGVLVVSNPEFLKEGAAVHDFNHPDRIVMGAQNPKAFEVMREVYSGLLRTYIPVVETSWENAEIIKYANNCFLATKISFINELANICERANADVRVVSRALGLDYRISPRFLNAGIGYGGSCFPKDVRALIQFAKQHGYDAGLLRAADELNERQKRVLVDKLGRRVPDVNGKVIAVLGLSFKPKTSDIRDAASLTVIRELLDKGAVVRAYDPEANEEAKVHFGKKITIAKGAYDAAKGADAVLLLTEWDEFRNLDLKRLAGEMKGKVLLDGRNVYDSAHAEEAGLVYEGIGRAA